MVIFITLVAIIVVAFLSYPGRKSYQRAKIID